MARDPIRDRDREGSTQPQGRSDVREIALWRFPVGALFLGAAILVILDLAPLWLAASLGTALAVVGVAFMVW